MRIFLHACPNLIILGDRALRADVNFGVWSWLECRNSYSSVSPDEF